MTIKVAYEWSYEYIPYQGFQLRIQRDYLLAKAEFLGHRDVEVLELGPVEGPKYHFVSVSRKKVDADLPRWASWFRFFSPANTVTQIERWYHEKRDGVQAFALIVKVRGIPVVVRGHGELKPTGIIGCQYDVRATVHSWVPLLGRQLEEIVATQLRHTMEGEAEFAGMWLSTHRVQ